MPKRIYPNSGGGFLGASADSVATTFTLYDAATFPSPSPGEEYTVRIGNELCLVTGKSGNVLTVSRAQQGTSAGSYVAGELIHVVFTADDLLRLGLVSKNGSVTGTRREINFIDGTGIQTTLVDNPTLDRVDVTITSTTGNAQIAPPFRLPGRTAPLTAPPALNQWTWVNQGSCAADEYDGVITLALPNANANQKVAALVRSVPAHPYTVTAAFQLWGGYTSTFYEAGIVLRESTSGKIVTAAAQYSAGKAQIAADKRATPTSTTTNYWFAETKPDGVQFIRLRDDGTNRIMGWSLDGHHWNERQISTRTDYLVADQVGFFVNSTLNQAATTTFAHLLSWAVS